MDIAIVPYTPYSEPTEILWAYILSNNDIIYAQSRTLSDLICPVIIPIITKMTMQTKKHN